MIRPREGNFIYSVSEMDTMIDSIYRFYKIGIRNFVTGMMTDNLDLNREQIKILAELYTDIKLTIHKCIDLTRDPLKEIENLKSIQNVNSILSSGQARTAIEGIDTLNSMYKMCGGRLKLIVAGKVTEHNLNRLLRELKATEYHGRNIV